VVPAFIPSSYISEATLRIQAFRSIAQITSREQLDKLRKEWRDRFGPLPPAAQNLATLSEIKLAAARANITRVDVRDTRLMLTRGGDFILVGGKFPRISTGERDRDRPLAAVLELLRQI
jgi:transcription-repair coupling factor (superfamily II helicase)